MASIKNAEYYVDNGVDFDEYRFKTDADVVLIEDVGGLYASTDVENALQEIAKKFLSGTGTFNTTTGRTITHTAGVTTYKVCIQPTGDSGGTIGEYWVESKTTTSFVVKNSGSNTTTTFDWILIK
jgi:hypothetical protein